METLLCILLILWAVSNMFGPVFYYSYAYDNNRDVSLFVPCDIVKDIRKHLNIPGTILAVTLICIWFSLAVLMNILLIGLLFVGAIILGWFYILFKRRDK